MLQNNDVHAAHARSLSHTRPRHPPCGHHRHDTLHIGPRSHTHMARGALAAAASPITATALLLLLQSPPPRVASSSSLRPSPPPAASSSSPPPASAARPSFGLIRSVLVHRALISEEGPRVTQIARADCVLIIRSSRRGSTRHAAHRRRAGRGPWPRRPTPSACRGARRAAPCGSPS